MTIYPIDKQILKAAIVRLSLHTTSRLEKSPAYIAELNRVASRLCDYRFRIQRYGGIMYITDTSQPGEIIQPMYNAYLDHLNEILEQTLAKCSIPYLAKFVKLDREVQTYGFELIDIGALTI